MICSLALSTRLSAQAVDIIRGRVTGPDSQPIVGVLVTATTLSGNVNRIGRTDKNGRFTISFPGGEGDYWVTFTSLGYALRRYEVKRAADEEILIANARMTPSAVTLESFQVVDRGSVARADTVSDVGGTERTVGADQGFLSVEQIDSQWQTSY